jgi:glycosyltransferase involved in cell wall biosynthesis
MPKTSIIIPSRNERYLAQTVDDIFAKAAGDVEVIVVLDGYWPVPILPDRANLLLLHRAAAQGMRAAINAAASLARGEYLLKCDAHCLFAPGFDQVLAADCDGDWVVVPRRYPLDPEAWAVREDGKPPVDAHYLSYPYEGDRLVGLHGRVWRERARARANVPVDDEMSSQGSCWFMTKRHFARIGPLEEAGYGTFAQEFQEIGNKTWLSGGAVKVNKQTWYAHWRKDTRGYALPSGTIDASAAFSVDCWVHDRWPKQTRTFAWLIERFWPVPGWPEDWRGHA